MDGQVIEGEEQSAAKERFAGRLTSDVLEEKVGHIHYSSVRTLDLGNMKIKGIQPKKEKEKQRTKKKEKERKRNREKKGKMREEKERFITGFFIYLFIYLLSSSTFILFL